jgi:hypothetical protein
MKKITVEFKETGTENFFAEVSAKIKINGKFCDNKVANIIDKALTKNSRCKYDVAEANHFYCVQVNVTFPSNNVKTFTIQREVIPIQEGYKIFKKELGNLVEFIQQIENFVEEAFKDTKTYVLEYN